MRGTALPVQFPAPKHWPIGADFFVDKTFGAIVLDGDGAPHTDAEGESPVSRMVRTAVTTKGASTRGRSNSRQQRTVLSLGSNGTRISGRTANASLRGGATLRCHGNSADRQIGLPADRERE